MKSQLIKTIEKGSPGEREKAAIEICQRRITGVVDDLLSLLVHKETSVRELVAVILGVIGDKKAIDALNEISRSDSDTNVRVAAIVAREYAGKLTYNRLKAEIKRYHGDHDKEEKRETELPEPGSEKGSRKSRRRRGPVIREMPVPEKPEKAALITKVLWKQNRRVLIPFLVIVALGTLAGALILSRTRTDRESPAASVQGSAAVANMIKERIAAIDKFKRTSLDPESPASMYPMTLELRTITGDTYGDLFEKVYAHVLPTETGLNTLGAFWRHVNFGSGEKQYDPDLMEQETSGELLLFPNPAALNLVLDVKNSSMAFQ